MPGPEIDSELNDLLIRLLEVTIDLCLGAGDRKGLLKEREALLYEAQTRGLVVK